MILGVIADDFTGATDVASMLVRGGMRTSLIVGVPEGSSPPDTDAVVVALKSRTAHVRQAVDESLAALVWLRAGGARQIYLKVCSTFDSTPQGNIGPVADALAAALGAATTVVCPALPENGRTVYMGNLFVGTQPLAESGMRHHPLTPMKDSNIVRVMAAQTPRPVGLVAYPEVAAGEQGLRASLEARAAVGCAYVVVDAIASADLETIAKEVCDSPLVVAGSGIAQALPATYVERGWLRPDARAAQLERVEGAGAVLSGSCSAATQAQVSAWRRSGAPALQIDVREIAADASVAQQAANWALGHSTEQPVLIYATALPSEVQAVQRELGTARAGELVEQCLAAIAVRLVAGGVQRLVVAGGETSGAVVRALDVQRLHVGPSIAPGVPWTAVTDRPLHLALKSGNFGGTEFFRQALDLQP